MTTMNPWMPERDPFVLRRVGKTGEEVSELAKVCFRIVIQGINGIDPATHETNIQEMVKEMADVMAQIELNIEAWDLDVLFMSKRIQRKKELMAEWEALVVGDDKAGEHF